ncbi:glycine betaine ABC transporter substrate-binding protein [Natrinema longum]|uniref:ABC transporter substrate-binding protein n=1 Tax=Natrinema longum TaxID=370324 RepID=UPI001CCB6535|nr:glycine betaine ABC transporter substrate-binding protein [Natrinema longum]MBZ6496963.1 glycine/betaine ABC transporter substrate-binding protein [Natrinema longum]
MSHQDTRRQFLRQGSATAAVLGVTGLAGCSDVLSSGGGGDLAIGSKQYAEQEILGYLAYHGISENTDYDATDEVSLGGSNTNFQALQNGNIDLYWEYSGTAWATLPPQRDEVISDSDELHDRINEDFQEEHDMELLPYASFNNTYVLITTADWQSETGVETISGLTEYINDGNTDMTIVMDEEVETRDDGWQGLIKEYGFEDAASDLDTTPLGAGLIYQAVAENEAEVGIGYNTNPNVARYDLQVIEDDRDFFQLYNPAPIVRQDTLDEFGEIRDPLEEIAGSLDTETIRNLNKRVSIDEEEATDVAMEHLENIDLA